jgi:hypothetical protein
MKIQKLSILIVLMILLLGISPLTARESKMAAGFQLGFAAMESFSMWDSGHCT